ncbi:MAG TPA: YceI family protein [Novimethylophilus sp.]|jgi:polyisoprenoid-binding protein YceI|uniref:YceI family protein n=1 Tax=Novimethylophilus sp. TaxID=2137426 RepID=UPI002F41E489
MKKTASLFLLLWAGIAAADVEIYGIDNSHSFANFTIRHVVSRTTGTFPDVKGKITIDRSDLSKSSVEARINVLSVNTSHAKRDEHIREKPDYLDAGKFGKMTFVSTKVEARGKDEGVITGNLTLHGVTREISFPFRVLGFGPDPWGGQRAGFEGHTAIKAADYGFGWAAEPNGPVGNEIEIALFIEGVKNSPDFKPW